MKTLIRNPQWYGWTPDHPDQRDFLYADVAPKRVKLSASVDLRAHCSPVENQGQLGSCTANALVAALEFLEKLADLPFVDLSRLFVYFDERQVEGTINSDAGALIRDGVKTLAAKGVCSETLWPYLIGHFKFPPTANCYKEAALHRISSYHRLTTITDMRTCLAEGFPFVFGFTVYEGFESESVAKTGVLNMPTPEEKTVGGHAVMAVGYNDKAKRILVRNSWGDDWGQAGYFTMPYAYVEDRNLSDDFWTIRQ